MHPIPIPGETTNAAGPSSSSATHDDGLHYNTSEDGNDAVAQSTGPRTKSIVFLVEEGLVSGEASESTERPSETIGSLDLPFNLDGTIAEEGEHDDDDEWPPWRRRDGRHDDMRGIPGPDEADVDRKLLSESYARKDHVEEDENKKYNKVLPRPFQRCWSGCWDTNPRCCALIVRVMFPMVVLMSFAIFGGWILAGYEAPHEYNSNDEIMAARKSVSRLDLNGTTELLVELPVMCLNSVLKNYMVDAAGNNTMVDSNTNITIDFEGLGENFSLPQFVEELRSAMDECSHTAGLVKELFLELDSNEMVTTAFSRLSFSWIRCWNQSMFGPLETWTPTEPQLEAARNQDIFYAKVWEEDFEYWLNYYLENSDENETMVDDEVNTEQNQTNSTDTGGVDAYDKALRKATGSSQCFLNKPGTSWFFFTVMTTIGYGNQSPATFQGRILMVTFGFVSILLFGGILASSGSVVAVIYDDTVKKLRWSFLARPVWSTMFWGIITALWTLIMGGLAYSWWTYRLNPEDVPSTRDAIWFAYLTTTTIGLGDFFLQPEVLFMSDAFTFAFVFLAAFTFFAAFLTRLSDLILGEFPDCGEILKIRLEETTILGAIPNRIITATWNLILNALRGVPSPIAIMASEEGAEAESTKQNEEDDADRYGDNEAILDLLVKYSKCDKRTLGVVQREEELLTELLNRTRKERRKLQLIGARPTINKQAASRMLIDPNEDSTIDFQT